METSNPLSSGVFASRPPSVQSFHVLPWLDQHGYTGEPDANLVVHAALTSVLTELPVFGLRVGLSGGTRDSDVDVFVFQMSKILSPSLMKRLLETALETSCPLPGEGDPAELRAGLMQRRRSFEDYIASAQAKRNTFFYGFVTYEKPSASLLVLPSGVDGTVNPTTIEVVVGAMAFKQPSSPLTASEVDTLGVSGACEAMNERGGRIFRFAPPARMTPALAEYVLRAQVESEREQEPDPSSVLVAPHTGMLLRR